ncbi:MAG: ComF family protein [Bacteroidales bacterium]
MDYISDFISIIFPRICAGCGNSLWKNEEALCHFCEYHLPKTDFHLDPLNPVARLFYGRVEIDAAAAYLYFNKGSNVQRLIHQLKYKGRKDVGIYLGSQYGHCLKTTQGFSRADAIIPVPLHKKKYMKRGYNQSEQIAIGLSEAMNIPVNRHMLVRTKATDTQTRKSRFSRYQNVKEIFMVKSPLDWEGKHLILVDDVITTGATLESCVMALSAIPKVQVSIAGIATAMI